MSGNADDKTQAGDFDALLGELDTLAKSMPSTDDVDKIKAAAGEGEPDGDEDGKGPGDGDEDDEGEGGEPMAKSFRIVGADGQEIEALDGGALIKGLMAQQSTAQEQFAKSTKAMVSVVQQQGTLIKSLAAKVEELAGQGRGRKSVLNIADRSAAAEDPLAKGGQGSQAPTGREILAKASAAYAAGKGGLTSLDIARIESRCNRGEPIPAEVVQKVLAAS